MLPILLFSLFNPVLNPSNLIFLRRDIGRNWRGWTCLLAGRWWRTGTGSPDSELEAGGGAERWALGQVLPGHPPLRRAPEAGVAGKTPPIMTLDLSLGLSVFLRNVQHICQYVIWDLFHLRGVTGRAKEDEIIVWEQISLGGYHGQAENSVYAHWKAHFPQL